FTESNPRFPNPRVWEAAMKWFYNLPVSAKLLSGFIMVALIAGVIGYVSITKMTALKVSGEAMYDLNTKPLGDLIDVSTLYQRLRVNLRELFIDRTVADREKHLAKVKELDKQIGEAMKLVENGTRSAEVKKAIADADTALNNYDPIWQKVAALLMAGKADEAYLTMRDPANFKIASAVGETIAKVTDLKV